MDDYKLYLPGGKLYIKTIWTMQVRDPAEWQYYMRRGDRYYFKNIRTGDKINILSLEFKNMKYGEVYELKFDVE